MRIPIAIASVLLLASAPVVAGTVDTSIAVPVRGVALIAAVTARAPGARVDVAPRSTGEWGFGSAAVAAVGDAYPTAWLFVARRAAGSWQVALQGEPAFARLAAVAPILGGDERRVLGRTRGGAGGNGGAGGGGSVVDSVGAPGSVRSATIEYGDRRTGVGLPYAIGQAWRLSSGPHPMSGSVRSSLDLTGGDGKVRAAADGIAYTMCGGHGWIRILHARGFATDYYHLRGNVVVDGVAVRTGDFLGYIGNDVSCGGHSTGPHVHFSLLRNGEYVPIDRYAVGQWLVSAGRSSRVGTLRHGSRIIGVGDLVLNYGPQALDAGVVDTGGGLYLPRRSGPSDRYRAVGRVADGATVTVRCSVRGPGHIGRSAYPTTLWDRLSDGSYVSDAYLTTGTSGPVRGYCP
jgi:LasA protease